MYGKIARKTMFAAVMALGVFMAVSVQATPIFVVSEFGEELPDTGSPGSINFEGNVYSVMFDAGAAAEKLIFTYSSEGGNNATIKYDGNELTRIDDTFLERNRGIWYLDLADTTYTGGSKTLSIDLTTNPTVNGIGYGVVSIAGAAPGAAAVSNVIARDNGDGDPSGLSVDLNVPNNGSFVVTNHGSNSNLINIPAGHIELYKGDNIGSAAGAATYLEDVVAGNATYTYSGNLSSNVTSAAAFVDVHFGREAITGLFNTGVDGSGVANISDASPDPHYSLTLVPSGSSAAVVAKATDGLPGSWLGDSATSAWIGPNNDADDALEGPEGSYRAETTFTLPGNADLSTVAITGMWATDNGGVDIFLNGNSLLASGDLAATEVSSAFGSFTPFSIQPDASLLVLGTNTLTFAWINGSGDPNPVGVRVDALTGSFLLVPEPNAVALALLGILGLVTLLRLRQR